MAPQDVLSMGGGVKSFWTILKILAIHTASSLALMFVAICACLMCGAFLDYTDMWYDFSLGFLLLAGAVILVQFAVFTCRDIQEVL